jgi:nucleoid-associated protein YgaU
MRLLLVPVLALFCTACVDDGTRSGGGVLITNDGRFVANTDVNAKAETERAIVTSLTERLGPAWQVAVQIQELPDLHGDPAAGMPEWRWAAAHAQVVLRGAGPPPRPVAAVQGAVERYLTKKLAHRATGPVVVTVTVQAPLADVAPAPAPVVAPAVTGGARRYTVQAGDTWADLSTAFYGSPEGWRTIRDANGGAERPTVGTVVVIPVR